VLTAGGPHGPVVAVRVLLEKLRRVLGRCLARVLVAAAGATRVRPVAGLARRGPLVSARPIGPGRRPAGGREPGPTARSGVGGPAVRALPGGTIRALPGGTIRALPGGTIRALPGGTIRALPGGTIRALPGGGAGPDAGQRSRVLGARGGRVLARGTARVSRPGFADRPGFACGPGFAGPRRRLRPRG